MVTESFLKQCFSESGLQEKYFLWNSNSQKTALQVKVSAGLQETESLTQNLAKPLNHYELECNFLPTGYQQRLSNKMLIDSAQGALDAYVSIQNSEDNTKMSFSRTQNELILWQGEIAQTINENSIDSVYAMSDLTKAQQEQLIAERYQKFVSYLRTKLMPQIYKGLERLPQYKNKSQRELATRMFEEEALNFSFRPGVMNVTPGNGRLEFTADLPIALTRPSQASSGNEVETQQLSPYTLSAMLQHDGLANFGLHCTGYIKDGQVFVESETVRTASPYPILGDSLIEKNELLLANFKKLFKELASMHLKKLEQADKDLYETMGQNEKNPINIKLDVIPLLSMMIEKMADLDPDQQFHISTSVTHMLLRMKADCYSVSDGEREKYFTFDPKIFPIGINGARVIPGNAQERYLTWAFNGMCDDLAIFFEQEKFQLPRLKPIKKILHEMLYLDQNDSKIKKLWEAKTASWKTLELKYQKPLPKDTKALRAYFRELDLLWKKHNKNERAIFNVRKKVYAKQKKVLQKALERLRSKIYTNFIANDPSLYKNEKQFYNSAQALLMAFELLSQSQYGFKKFRLQAGILPIVIWYLSQQQEHVAY